MKDTQMVTKFIQNLQLGIGNRNFFEYVHVCGWMA